MGKGDQKSKRGKIHIGTYGKSRPARVKAAPVAAKAATPAKKKTKKA
jgi:30S ribosomal protein S31